MRKPLGTVKSVLIQGVSLFQGLINTHLYCIGTQKSVLIIEVSPTSNSPHLNVPLLRYNAYIMWQVEIFLLINV